MAMTGLFGDLTTAEVLALIDAEQQRRMSFGAGAAGQEMAVNGPGVEVPQTRMSGTYMPGFSGPGMPEPEWDPQSIIDSQRSADQAFKAFSASAADPLGIPSAIIGLFSPETRDSWRETQRSAGLAPQLAGGVTTLGPLGAGIAQVPTAVGKMATMAGLGGASDVIDAAAGQDGAVGVHTLGKMALGAAGYAPTRLAGVGLGATGGAAMGGLFSSPAAAAESPPYAPPLTPADEERRQRIQGKRYPTEAEQRTLQQLNERASAAGAYAEWDKARTKREAAAEAERLRNESEAKVNGEIADARLNARNAYGKTMGELKTWGQTPWAETTIGSTLNESILPAIIGGLTGLIKGGATARSQGKAVQEWKDTIKRGESATVPSAKFEAARMADDFNTGRFAPGWDGLGPVAKSYAVPVAAGAIEGAAGTSTLPYLWDASLHEKNPERAAWLAYKANLLPSDTAEQTRVAQILGNTPEDNPARTKAREYLWSGDHAKKAAAQAAIGAVAGATGKTFGYMPFAPGMMPREATRNLVAQTGATVDDTAGAMYRTAKSNHDYARSRQLLDQQQQLADAAAQLEARAIEGLRTGPVPNMVTDQQRAALMQFLSSRQGQQLQPAGASNPPTPPPPTNPTPTNVPPTPPTAQPAQIVIPPGTKPNPNWEAYSRSGRDAVYSLMDELGLHLGAKGSGRITADQVHALLKDAAGNAPAFKVNTTQASLKRLRDIMIANGDNPATLLPQQLAKYKGLDPKLFAVPAGVGIGAGLWDMAPAEADGIWR